MNGNLRNFEYLISREAKSQRYNDKKHASTLDPAAQWETRELYSKYFDLLSKGSRVEFPYKRRWSLYCRRSSICRHIRELHSRYVCTPHGRAFGPSAVIIIAIMHIQISNQHHWGSGQGSRSLKRGFTRELLAKRVGERILNIVFLLQKPDIESINREKWMQQSKDGYVAAFKNMRKTSFERRRIFETRL